MNLTGEYIGRWIFWNLMREKEKYLEL